MSSDGLRLRLARKGTHPFQLRRVALRHFKSADCTDVALRPLSVVVGANSSGKSSLLQAITATVQTLQKDAADDTFILNGKLVRLGSYADVLNIQHRESGEPIMVGFRLQVLGYSAGITPTASDTEPAIQDYALDAALFLTQSETGEGDSRIEAGSVCISVDSVKKELALWTPVKVPIDQRKIAELVRHQSLPDLPLVQVSHLIQTKTFRIEFSVLADDPIDEGVSELHPFWSINPAQPLTHMGHRSDKSDITGNETQNEDGLFLRLVTPMDQNPLWSLRTVDDLSDGLFSSRVHCLGPLRASPPDSRSVDSSGVRGIGTQGEHTATVLRDQASTWASLPMPDGHEQFVPIGDALNKWLNWFGLVEAAETREHGRLAPGLVVRPRGVPTFVDLSSVGVGVSQILPVILLCLLSRPADLLVLEQPDSLLHPELQKRIADFLLVFVRAGRQILVETHSDHLVNQLRYQVAADETDQTGKLVKLIFAEQKNGITNYRESETNEYGGLSEDWPDGFLDISARSAQDLVRHSLQKMKMRRSEPAEGTEERD